MNKVMEESKKDVIHTCTNPQVMDGTLCCDGNCNMCGYHQPLPKLEVNNKNYISIEDYKKMYEDAFEVVKRLHSSWASTQNRAAKEIEEAFPQLKKSEDEKMKDIIFDALSANESQERIEKHGINLIDCVEWLQSFI